VEAGLVWVGAALFKLGTKRCQALGKYIANRSAGLASYLDALAGRPRPIRSCYSFELPESLSQSSSQESSARRMISPWESPDCSAT